MANAVALFDYEGNTIRTVTVGGEPWFVAADIAKALGYASAKDFVRGVDEEDKGRHNLPTPSGDQSVTIISEGGLYTALVKSRTERTRPFRRWVTHEVLPSFRGSGSLIAATDFTFPFDGIKRDGPNGEYWSARELFGDATEKGGGRPREDYLLLRFAEGRT